MRVVLLYVYIVNPSEPEKPVDFASVHRRFAASYRKYFPEIPHVFMPVLYRGERDAEAEKLFEGLNPQWAYYAGSDGFDMGAFQHVGQTLDCDLVVGLNSQNHFWKHGWLERFVEAHKKHPDSLLSPWGSYENSPHLRGACMAFPPKFMRKYPYRIERRELSYKAESGDWNMTQWAQREGLGAYMVTWDEILAEPDWRKPLNCFRRGNESDCIIFDRHTLYWKNASPQEKLVLSRSADGINAPRKSPYMASPAKTITVVAVTSLAPASHAQAINRTVALIPHPCKKLLISPTRPMGFDGQWVSVPDLMPGGKWSLNDMCRFLLRGLHAYIQTDVAILVQWDGYAINGAKWLDAFLEYDYVGAPWPASFPFVKANPRRRVGNGGFSLRSKRWLEHCANLPTVPAHAGIAEDVYASSMNAEHFERAGMKIAPLDVAMRWSMEYRIEEFRHWKLSDSWGFHGLVDRDPERAHLRLNPNV